MANLTKRGAREVTDVLDRVANLFQTEAATLGVDSNIATDFAYRCDLLADHVEKHAGVEQGQDRTAADALGLDLNSGSNYDPSDIGREVGGPLEQLEKDEPYMNGQFTQKENREVRDVQEAGKLGPKVNLEPMPPQAGKQAAAQASDAIMTKLAALEAQVQTLTAALKKAEDEEKKEDETEEKKAEECAKDSEDEKVAKKASHGFNLSAK